MTKGESVRSNTPKFTLRRVKKDEVDQSRTA